MPEAEAACRLRGRRILVVEDDYVMAQDLATELSGAGVVVLGPVADVAGALGLLAAGPVPDAAVLDINLGGEMVYPLVDTLQERHIPFLFATGYEACSIPERYRGLPRLEKPVDVKRIAEALGA